MIEPFTETERPQLISRIRERVSEFMNCSQILVNTMPAIHEACFRDYLLDVANHQVGLLQSPTVPPSLSSLVLRSLSDLSLLFSQCKSYFFRLPPLEPIHDWLTVSLHCKKSINSKKAYLAMLDRDHPVQDRVDLTEQLASLTADTQFGQLTSADRQALADRMCSDMTDTFESLWFESLNEGSLPKPHTEKPSAKEEEYLSKMLAAEGLNFNTLSLKLETYVPETAWKALSIEQKRELTTYIHFFKRAFDKELLKWAIHRIDHKDSSFESISDLTANVKILEQPVFGLGRQTNRQEWRPRDLSREELKQQFETSSCNYSLPLYTVDTRDCFSYDPIIKETKVIMRGREVTKKEYFFEQDQLPSNFAFFKERFPDGRIGVVTYEGFFSHEELTQLEHLTHMTELEFFKGSFLPNTGQVSISGKRIKRTKFFFGSRYMWSALQICEPHASLAGGIRTDVSPIPSWMIEKVEGPLVENGIIPKDFINSLALNVYHDGEEGLGQHFDDAIRFRQVASPHKAHLLPTDFF